MTTIPLAASAAGPAPSAPPAEHSQADPTLASGWELVAAPLPEGASLATICTVDAEGVIHTTGKPVGYVQTTATFANYRLHAEWRWPDKPANGGILLHIDTGPKDRQWPECFQVQLKAEHAGDLLPMAGAAFAEPLTPAASTGKPATQLDHQQPAKEAPAGGWNTCDVVCRDGTIDVTINGVHQNHVTGCTPASGHVGFQLEGAPIELRAYRVTPLP